MTGGGDKESMKFGILNTSKMNVSSIKNGGFEYAELPIELLDERLKEVEEFDGINLSGVMVSLKNLDETKLLADLERAQATGAKYLLIETIGVQEEKLSSIIGKCVDKLSQVDIEIYIENGVIGDELKGYAYGPYSLASDLQKLVDEYNSLLRKDMFGISLNFGYMNLISKNYRSEIYLARKNLKHIHINDNDAIHNDRQMPYTFTRGRGQITTDWLRSIGELIRMKYQGWMIFDTVGLWDRSPIELHESFMRLLKSVADEWLMQYHLEDEVLDNPDKKLILFGSGAMMKNYLDYFGEKYPPAFAVDNSKAKWGTTSYGVPVEAPEKIMEIPENERTVLLCCGYYTEIGDQLKQMGVEYRDYIDFYFWV